MAEELPAEELELPPLPEQAQLALGIIRFYKGDHFKALVAEVELMRQHERAIRIIHQKEMFGDCVEDGEVYPCKTIQILDWRPE